MPFLFTRQQTGIDMICITQIDRSKYQPRQHFSQKALEGLAESIKEHGILSPLTVVRAGERYELIAGERRLRAAKLAGLDKVPCIVTDKSEREQAQIALVENIQREQLSFFEEAEGFLRLIDEFGLSQAEIAKKLGKRQSTVSNKMRLLKLPLTARAIITAAELSERHARELLRIHDKDKLFYALDKIVEKKLNVPQTERFITELLSPPPVKPGICCKVGDVRIFINTINKAVDLIKKSGIKPSTQLQERDGFVEYIIKIPKSS